MLLQEQYEDKVFVDGVSDRMAVRSGVLYQCICPGSDTAYTQSETLNLRSGSNVLHGADRSGYCHNTSARILLVLQHRHFGVRCSRNVECSDSELSNVSQHACVVHILFSSSQDILHTVHLQCVHDDFRRYLDIRLYGPSVIQILTVFLI
ncbi:unnamed protein product [Dicrocoelium dendriticum]|nr:unnamed protein product [Dicrocoelium dendriticum]